MNSTLVKKQVKTFLSPAYQARKGVYVALEVKVRYDDQCGNGHNTFAITADEIRYLKDGSRRAMSNTWYSGGCQHDLVAKKFPGLAPLIKWHLVSSDGPMHYIANTLYWAELAHKGGDQSRHSYGEQRTREGCLKFAKSSAVGTDLPDEFFAVDEGEQEIYPGVMVPLTTFNRLKGALEARLPQLLEDFKKDVEGLGFTF